MKGCQDISLPLDWMMQGLERRSFDEHIQVKSIRMVAAKCEPNVAMPKQPAHKRGSEIYRSQQFELDIVNQRSSS